MRRLPKTARRSIAILALALVPVLVLLLVASSDPSNEHDVQTLDTGIETLAPPLDGAGGDTAALAPGAPTESSTTSSPGSPASTVTRPKPSPTTSGPSTTTSEPSTTTSEPSTTTSEPATTTSGPQPPTTTTTVAPPDPRDVLQDPCRPGTHPAVAEGDRNVLYWHYQKQPPDWGLVSVRPDGSGATLIVPGDGFNTVWSPDGETIAYRDMIGDLILLNADGTDKHSIRPTGHYVSKFSWAPDGQTIAAVMRPPGDSLGNIENLYLVDLDGKIVRQLTHGLNLFWSARPAWSPDGLTLMVDVPGSMSGGGIWAVDAAGGIPARLAGDGFGASWSPDGCQIAFATDRGYEVMRWDGSRRRTVLEGAAVPQPGSRWQPYWSPATERLLVVDGNRILLLDGPEFLAHQLFVGSVQQALWSPDGTRIVFIESFDPTNHVWVIGVDGTGLVQIDLPGFHHDPGW